ncbi:ABC transporter substrate-binding protein, partial [Rhizobium leguminosarum]|uniref:ABC transporter substrate-binding protein n=1 Tax=Rhizobium leguminosarum TaxID=384 RepID=UPI003F95CE52
LRQAFSLAIDRDAVNQIVYECTAVSGNHPFPPSSPWFDKDIPVPARDLDKAKALIKEAGFADHRLDDLHHLHGNGIVGDLQLDRHAVEAG